MLICNIMGVLVKTFRALVASIKLRQIRRKNSDSIIFVATSGLGDICYALSYISALKKANNKKVLVVCSPYAKELLTFYPDIDEIICLTDKQTKYFKPLGNTFLARFHFNNKNNRIPVYTCDAWSFLPMRVVNLPNINFFDIINYVNYELRGVGEIQYPIVPECDIEKFHIINWEKTIVINPHSNFLNTNSSIFKKSASLLVAKGYQVFTNVSSCYDKPIEGTAPLVCNLQEFYNIVKRIKCLISVRSGLLDYAVNCGGDFLVIYNKDNDGLFKKVYSLNYWKGRSLITEFDSDQEGEIYAYIERL